MNLDSHQVTGGSIDQAMPGEGVFPREGLGNDVQAVMPTAVACPGMAGMQVRLVDDLNGQRGERTQMLAQQGNGVLAHAGNAFLKGLMVTFS